ncbi:MAG: hypothetical protein P8Y84_12430 [Desulfuromonadales bacterium]
MAYKIYFQEEDDLLRVEISGDREKAKLITNAREAWREIANVNREKKNFKVLIVSRATGKYPIFDALMINQSLAEYGVQRDWKIAFVNLDQASFSEVKVAEMIAVNRGFNLGVFPNEETARKWLLN